MRFSAKPVESPLPRYDAQMEYRKSIGGISSVGRASACQAEGRQFEPGIPLHFFETVCLSFERRLSIRVKILPSW